jgi:peptidoglycan/xylan/chitin deacetylase (PgdA/CDA1 family)
MENGKFVISLDFELNWGAAENDDLVLKKKYFDNTRYAVPKILELFENFNIHATWATVGFLFAKNLTQLNKFCPDLKPTYKNKFLSYYNLLDQNKIGINEENDPYHYGFTLISKILRTPNQELASHTFAHYYCNETGQTIDQFEADLTAAQLISKENFKTELKSLVFPRNQFNSEYLKVAIKKGILVVRSNPNVWFWRKTSKWMSVARAFDTLVLISNSLVYKKESCEISDGLLLLPASRFLRPYSKNEKFLQRIKLNRVKKEMTKAAKNNEIYHLWWHPHNFGSSTKENLFYLEAILIHFSNLRNKYNFQSKSMLEMHM